MPTFSLMVDTERERADDVSADLFELGATGVEVRDGEATPMPGEAPPPPGRAVVIGFFPGRREADLARSRHGGRISEIADEDWGESWKRGLAPLLVGRAFVRPSWIDAPAPPGAAEIVLDPGMAFGTGTHATTALCLAALSDLLGARPGADVLDVGTGSGLLAIAAAKLGAGRVVANDVDPVAVDVARENAARNGAEVDVTAAPAGEIPGPFDVVVANILANTLVELAPVLASRLALGGVVLLAGILAPQEEEVRAAYVEVGLRPVPGGDRREGEWTLLALERPRT